jgi:hypothetical protein
MMVREVNNGKTYGKKLMLFNFFWFEVNSLKN